VLFAGKDDVESDDDGSEDEVASEEESEVEEEPESPVKKVSANHVMSY